MKRKKKKQAVTKVGGQTPEPQAVTVHKKKIISGFLDLYKLHLEFECGIGRYYGWEPTRAVCLVEMRKAVSKIQ